MLRLQNMGENQAHYCVANLLPCNSPSTNMPSEIYKVFQTNGPSQEARKIKPQIPLSQEDSLEQRLLG